MALGVYALRSHSKGMLAVWASVEGVGLGLCIRVAKLLRFRCQRLLPQDSGLRSSDKSALQKSV